MANLYSTNRTGWLISPEMNVVASESYTLTFDYGITAFSTTAAIPMGSDDTVQVAMSVDGGLTWTETQLFNAASNISNTSNLFTYTFTATTSLVQFAIVANDGTVNDLEDYNFYVDNFEVQTELGTGNFDNTSFTAYPNPVKNMLNLNYTQDITDVSVFNLLGQQVITKKLNATNGQVDMSGLATGTYLVKVNTANGTKTLKVIKE